MKKIFISFAMMCMAMGGYAATEEDGTYVGWPANYGGVMLQGFWWDSYDATQWTELKDRVDELSLYFDLIWIPNSGMTSDYYYNQYNSMGYDPCFWLDHNSCFGTVTELMEMIDTYKAKNVGIIEDVVINHKNGLGSWVNFAQESNVVGPRTGQTYSITWDNTNYSGICSSDECNYNGYPTTGANDTGDDFSAYRDLDHTNTTVQNNIITYLDFLKNELGYAGFRYDMVKGYAPGYIKQYNTAEGIQPEFSVGEYWDNQTNIQDWIYNTAYASAAFDFPLKEKLNSAISGGDYSALAWKSFTYDPNYSQYAISFVDNHDTGRSSSDGGSPLVFNWSAANAFILASPGTPCVWLPHYNADPTNIGAMILARKAAGITNTECNVLTQSTTSVSSTDDGYILESQGTNGLVYCQFGNAVNQGVPTPSSSSNFTDQTYKLIASGDNYKFYATEPVVATPEVTITPEGGTFYTETLTVKLIPNNSAVKAWYKVGDNGTVVSITGETSIVLGGSDYPLDYDSSVTVYWGASDSSDDTTDDATGNATFNKVERSGESLYFRNTAAWDNVYCYIWNANGYIGNPWPGTKVETMEGLYNVISFEDVYPTGVIWNNGDGTQTEDLTYTAGRIYNSSGDTGDTYQSTATGTVSLNNAAGWSNVYCYAWDSDENEKLGAWPGEKVTASTDGKYYVSFYGETPDYVIWNNGSNASQTADLTYSNGTEYNNLVLYIAGSFNDWSTTSSAFKQEENRTWTYTLDLSSATENPTFKILPNGNWLGASNVTFTDNTNGWLYDDNSNNHNIVLNHTTAGCNKYLLTATWAGSGITSGWSLKVEGVYTYTVAGSDVNVFGTAWAADNTDNDMTENSSGIYELTKSNIDLTAGETYKYKVVRDHSWNTSYGDPNNTADNYNATYSVTESGFYTLVFTFDPSTSTVGVTLTKENSYWIDGSENAFSSSNIVALTDGTTSSFSSDVESFTAATATYSRSSSYQWGTLCLPFQVMNTYEGVTFYQLSGVDLTNNVLNFTPTSTIDAGKPVVYKVAEAGTDGKYTLNISERYVNVVSAPVTGDTYAGWTLVGAFSRQEGLVSSTDKALYYIAQDQFWHAASAFNCSAYRAWFETPGGATSAKLRISEEGGTEGIQTVEQDKNQGVTIIDLMGRQIDKSHKGLMIENGKVIFVK